VLHLSPDGVSGQLDDVAAALANPGTHPTTVRANFAHNLSYGGSYHLTWFADGRLAATYGSITELWDLNTGDRLALDESLEQSNVFWSPSGKQYAVASLDGHKVYNAQGMLLYQLPPISREELSQFFGSPDKSFLLQIAWNSSETQLATTDGKLIRLWEAASGKSLGALEQAPFPISSLSWSPDGSRIAAATGYVVVGASAGFRYGDNVVHIYDVSSRQEIDRFESPLDGLISLVVWSPNGKYLLTGNSLTDEDRLRVWRVWPSLQDLLEYAKSCCNTIQLSDEQFKQLGIKSR